MYDGKFNLQCIAILVCLVVIDYPTVDLSISTYLHINTYLYIKKLVKSLNYYLK